MIEQIDMGAGPQESSEPDNSRARRRRAPVRSPERTSQAAFRGPILEALSEMNGRGPVDEVLKRVYEKMKKQLSKIDHTTISTGEERWRVYARWERKNMEQEGLVKGPRGVWELTDKGRKEVAS
jgi:hypothetical protein